MSSREEPDEVKVEREQAIAERAYELFEARGGDPGREHADWVEAERQLVEEGTIEPWAAAEREPAG